MKKTKDLLFVGTQLLLFLLYLFIPAFRHFGISDFWKPGLLILSGVGLLIILISIWQLRSSLSPFPSPVENGNLVVKGLYRYVRHPVYTGILIFLGSYALYSDHLGRLGVVLILAVLFYFKSKYEEILLMDKFVDYQQYIKVTGRFLPGL